MALTSGTIALIGAGIAAAGATGGAIGSSANRKKAREEEQRYYQSAMDYLNSMYYRDPLTTVGNRSLIKQVKKNYEDNLDALQNRAVAGGATMENALAARQANNENLDKVYTTLLQGEDARRDRISAQKMSLEGQHSQNIQNGFYQAAQDWQQWGGQMAQAGMSLMSSGLLGDAGGAAESAGGGLAESVAAQHEKWLEPAAGAAAQNTGGLRGVYMNKEGVLIPR